MPPRQPLVAPRGRALKQSAARPAGAVPTLRTEREILRSGHVLLAAVDEVGRGALAGPVTVGVVLVDISVPTAPKGLRDSKLLAPAAREALVPRIRRWCVGHAVAHASADEIDRVGILAALRTAGERAFAALGVRPDCVLLDGNYDWLTRPVVPVSLFDDVGPPRSCEIPRVRTMIKADLRCASVAAASVLAKTTRDAIMEQLAQRHPGYGWEENRGYATPAHLDALRAYGPCCQHRRSWRLPDADEVGWAGDDWLVADGRTAADPHPGQLAVEL